MSLEVFAANVRRLVRDGAEILDPNAIEFAIREAVKRYSRARAREVVADIPGADGFDYDLPSDWTPDFSNVEQVEYPAGEREPVYVDKLDFGLYRSPAGLKLRFYAATPKVGETIRMTFSAMHDVGDDSTTVPVADFDIVNNLAAGIACEQLASHFSNAGDSTITADSVDHKSKAAEYASRAQRFIKMGTELLKGEASGDVVAAGGHVSLAGDLGLLSHPER